MITYQTLFPRETVSRGSRGVVSAATVGALLASSTDKPCRTTTCLASLDGDQGVRHADWQPPSTYGRDILGVAQALASKA